MTTLKASRLKAVLDKARNAGQVEEPVTIAGLELVMSSLPPEAYARILDELRDTSEHHYMALYQIEHVCRSVVEIDGQSLRDVEFIEIEGEPGGPSIKVERHQWVRDLVTTWSREAVQVAFRKVLDVIALAEERAAAGVQFKVESETDEERFRRLLGELKEAGTEVPTEMREAILKEEGLLVAASRAELDTLDERARTWAKPDEETPAPKAEAAPVVPSSPSPEVPVRAPQQLVQAASRPDPYAVTEPPPPPVNLAERVPLNQVAIREPIPVSPAEQNVVTANHRPPAPPRDQVHVLSSRAERLAAIEAMEGEVPVLHHEPPRDTEGARSIVDRPPTVGVNPKYSNPFNRGQGLDPRAVKR